MRRGPRVGKRHKHTHTQNTHTMLHAIQTYTNGGLLHLRGHCTLTYFTLMRLKHCMPNPNYCLNKWLNITMATIKNEQCALKTRFSEVAKPDHTLTHTHTLSHSKKHWSTWPKQDILPIFYPLKFPLSPLHPDKPLFSPVSLLVSIELTVEWAHLCFFNITSAEVA